MCSAKTRYKVNCKILIALCLLSVPAFAGSERPASLAIESNLLSRQVEQNVTAFKQQRFQERHAESGVPAVELKPDFRADLLERTRKQRTLEHAPTAKDHRAEGLQFRLQDLERDTNALRLERKLNR